MLARDRSYINASTCSVYVVAYNMSTEIYVCYSETQNEKGTKWQKKGNTQYLSRQRNVVFLCRGRKPFSPRWCYSPGLEGFRPPHIHVVVISRGPLRAGTRGGALVPFSQSRTQNRD